MAQDHSADLVRRLLCVRHGDQQPALSDPMGRDRARQPPRRARVRQQPRPRPPLPHPPGRRPLPLGQTPRRARYAPNPLRPAKTHIHLEQLVRAQVAPEDRPLGFVHSVRSIQHGGHPKFDISLRHVHSSINVCADFKTPRKDQLVRAGFGHSHAIYSLSGRATNRIRLQTAQIPDQASHLISGVHRHGLNARLWQQLLGSLFCIQGPAGDRLL